MRKNKSDYHQPGRTTCRNSPTMPIRAELVARVRREIASGTYETPEKFEKAFAKLLKRLQEE